MECPQCHFSQPRDVYCAKCGVEIKAYRAKQNKSIISRALKNPFIQGLGLMIITFGSLLVFFQNSKDPTEQNFFIASRQSSSAQKTTEQTPSASNNTNKKSSADELKNRALASSQTDLKSNIKSIEPNLADLKKLQLSSMQKFFSQYKGSLSISFLEASNDFISVLNRNKKVKNISPQYPKAVSLPKQLWRKSFSSQTSFVTAVASKKITKDQIQNSTPLVYNFLENDYGLLLRVTPKPSLEKSKFILPLRINAEVALPTQTEPIFGTLSFLLEISPNDVIVLEWDLPRTPPKFANGPLSIYNSESFLKEESSLFIAIQLN